MLYWFGESNKTRCLICRDSLNKNPNGTHGRAKEISSIQLWCWKWDCFNGWSYKVSYNQIILVLFTFKMKLYPILNIDLKIQSIWFVCKVVLIMFIGNIDYCSVKDRFNWFQEKNNILVKTNFNNFKRLYFPVMSLRHSKCHLSIIHLKLRYSLQVVDFEIQVYYIALLFIFIIFF